MFGSIDGRELFVVVERERVWQNFGILKRFRIHRRSHRFAGSTFDVFNLNVGVDDFVDVLQLADVRLDRHIRRQSSSSARTLAVAVRMRSTALSRNLKGPLSKNDLIEVRRLTQSTADIGRRFFGNFFGNFFRKSVQTIESFLVVLKNDDVTHRFFVENAFRLLLNNRSLNYKNKLEQCD